MADTERDDSLAMALGDLDTYEAEVAKLNRQVEELRGQRDEARKQLARALKVVQAANEWQLWDAQGALDTALYEWRAGLELSGPPLTAEEMRRVVAQLPASRQTASKDRPAATRTDDQGADDGAGTERSQAQGGAQVTVEPQPPTWTTSYQPAPADPAGLDAAIDEVLPIMRRWFDDDEAPKDTRHITAALLRAAAPHLRAATLNEAADAYGPTSSFGRWLIERAGREATS